MVTEDYQGALAMGIYIYIPRFRSPFFTASLAEGLREKWTSSNERYCLLREDVRKGGTCVDGQPCPVIGATTSVNITCLTAMRILVPRPGTVCCPLAQNLSKRVERLRSSLRLEISCADVRMRRADSVSRTVVSTFVSATHATQVSTFRKP